MPVADRPDAGQGPRARAFVHVREPVARLVEEAARAMSARREAAK